MANGNKRKRNVRSRAKSAAQRNVTTANTQTLLGQISGIESAAQDFNASARSAAQPVNSTIGSAASARVKGVRSSAASQPGSVKSASQLMTSTARSAAEPELQGPIKTPHFEGANAYDDDVGYFRVAPGQNPQDVLEELRRLRGMSQGEAKEKRRRTVEGR